MKILIAISNSFCANFIQGQGKYLIECGHEVVIVSSYGEEIEKLKRNEKVRVIYLPFKREISLYYDLISLFKIIKVVYKEKPDIINAGNPKTGFLFGLVHVFFYKTPMIFTLRGLRSDTLSGAKKKIVLITEKISCLFSNKTIAISPSLKEHAINLGLVSNEKCIVFSKGSSNGVNINKYKNNEESKNEAATLKTKLGIKEKDFVLSFVGRVTKDKGVEEMIQAFVNLNKKYRDTKLIIGGPIEKEDPLSEDCYKEIEINKSIFYLGKLRNVKKVYSSSDVLVLYSYREGFGNVALEASSMGLPTIVADIPGLRDTTVNEKTGLIITPKSHESLLKAYEYYYNNREKLKEHGNNGRQRVEFFFKNEIIWKKQLELYKSLIKKN